MFFAQLSNINFWFGLNCLPAWLNSPLAFGFSTNNKAENQTCLWVIFNNQHRVSEMTCLSSTLVFWHLISIVSFSFDVISCLDLEFADCSSPISFEKLWYSFCFFHNFYTALSSFTWPQSYLDRHFLSVSFSGNVVYLPLKVWHYVHINHSLVVVEITAVAQFWLVGL